MAKSLSEQLRLIVSCEDCRGRLRSAKKEGHDKVAARTKEAHAAVGGRRECETVDQSVVMIAKGDAMKAKVAADIDTESAGR